MVSPEWVEFACENGAAHLQPDAVMGRPIWEFILGAEVRHLYRLLFAKARTEKRRVTIPFRCDGPHLRRHMRLNLVLLDDGSLEFVSELLRVERRPAVTMLDATAIRSDEFMTMCAWCKRVPLEADEWVEVEQAIERLDLFGPAAPPTITHGICPDCASSIEKELAD